MGELRDKIFLEYINRSLDNIRIEFREKYIAKKDDRFLIKGLTYEIGPCQVIDNAFEFEISSKIPQNLLFYKSKKEKYFKKVVALLKKKAKKPASAKMENMIRNTQDEELKERDYVNVTYRYEESELYSPEDVHKRLKKHQSKGLPMPNIPGIATLGGKLVVVILEEEIANSARSHIHDLVGANEEVSKGFDLEEEHTVMPGARKKVAATKAPAPRPAAKPKAKAKPKTAAKPKAKPKAAAKPKKKKAATRK